MCRLVITLLVALQICHVIESLAPYAPPRCLQGSADPSDRLGCEWAAPFNARRNRRAIFAPELLVSENQRPPFPRRIGKVWRTSNAEDGHRFTLSASGSIEDPTRTFSIDATSGDVYVLRALDRERNATHQLTVSVMNRSGDVVEGPTVMLVHVLDQNDNRPRFQHEPFHAQLPEHAPRGHHVIHVEADDPDNPQTGNAELRYSLGPPRPPPANRSAVSFAIDPLLGDITTTSDPELLDREALATLTYELVVSVSDMAGGDSGLVRSSTVTVTIADINDNPPVFHPTTRFEVSVEENVVRPLLNLTVRDLDERGSANWEVSFSIISGDTDGTFNVSTRPHTNRGILGLAQPLDYETWRVHALLVRADNLAPLVPDVRLPHASTATIVVSVLDSNEAPVFHHGPNATVVAHQQEGLQPGAVVARLNASDPDLAQQQTVRYSVLSDPARWLRVEALSGVVTTTAVLDRESVHVNHGHDYEATFLATDNGHPPASSTATLLLRLSDENDHAPAVTPAWAFACAGRGALANRSLVTLVASDPHDLPGNAGPFTFRLGHRAQSPGPTQRLLALLGVPTEEEKLRLNWRLDVINETHADLVSLHEVARGEHLVPVSVSDSGRPPQTTLLVFNASVCSCSAGSRGSPQQPLDCSSGAPGGPPRWPRAGGVAAAAVLVVTALLAQGSW